MLPNSKILRFLHPPLPALPPHNKPTSPSPPPPHILIKQHCKFSRRDLTICTSSSLLLLGSALVQPFSSSRDSARAEQEDSAADIGAQENPPPSCADDKSPTKRAFLDISIDGKPAGRIVIGLYGGDAPAGVSRFSGLVSGAAGITYRRKEFVKIMPNYVQHGGVRSYGVDAELAKRTGAAESLVTEWDKINDNCPGTKNLARSVSIVVRDPTKPPPKIKLVAREGKLQIDEEEVGSDPNGTQFVIVTKDSPELDASTLVIGRVLEGMEVVERIGQVKTVKDNTGSPYFRIAKLIGDKRATVAERGFNRPYSKVLITNCGLIQ